MALHDADMMQTKSVFKNIKYIITY